MTCHQPSEQQIENAKLATAIGNFVSAARKANEAGNALRGVVAGLSANNTLPGVAFAARDSLRDLEATLAPFGGAVSVDRILSGVRDTIQRSDSFDKRREAFPTDLRIRAAG